MNAFNIYMKIIDYLVRAAVSIMIVGLTLGNGLAYGVYRKFTYAPSADHNNNTYTFDLEFFGIMFLFLIFGFIGLHFIITMAKKIVSYNKYVNVVNYVTMLIKIGIWTWISVMLLMFLYIAVLFFNPTLSP